jgi:hypothetical protein
LVLRPMRAVDIAAGRLASTGHEVTTPVGETGVVGVPRNEGPTVMLRAEARPPKLRTRLGQHRHGGAMGEDSERFPTFMAALNMGLKTPLARVHPRRRHRRPAVPPGRGAPESGAPGAFRV